MVNEIFGIQFVRFNNEKDDKIAESFLRFNIKNKNFLIIFVLSIKNVNRLNQR